MHYLTTNDIISIIFLSIGAENFLILIIFDIVEKYFKNRR